jgi:flavorubredoxin
MMSKALVLFATRYGQTKTIAQHIVDGMRSDTLEVDLVDIAEFDKKGVDPGSYDAVVIGSATYHGEMMPPVKTLLFSLEKANLAGKTGGSFGSYGWSGEAPLRIYDTMQHVLRMNMVDEPLRIQTAQLTGAEKKCRDYGSQIAMKLAGKAPSKECPLCQRTL